MSRKRPPRDNASSADSVFAGSGWTAAEIEAVKSAMGSEASAPGREPDQEAASVPAADIDASTRTTSHPSPRRGRLVVVGTPIGHPEDLSPRAATALAEADLIACEERSEAARILRRLALVKELVELNEHTERAATEELLEALRGGARVALISDCGMPVFADPGTRLVRMVHEEGIALDVVPGATSLTTALAVAGIDVHRFYFHGFLSPKRPERAQELSRLRSFDMPIVFLDAPYRLNAVLDDLRTAFGPGRTACVACDLTLPSQLIMRGTLSELAQYFAAHQRKREFVIIVDSAHRPYVKHR